MRTYVRKRVRTRVHAEVQEKRIRAIDRRRLSVCAVFFCTYSLSHTHTHTNTLIYISRRLCFSILSLRKFFCWCLAALLLYCALSLRFRSLSFALRSSTPINIEEERTHIKEFVCFPFVFGLLFLFPLFHLFILARIYVFADVKCTTHTYRKKKAIEGEEDEPIHNRQNERGRVVLLLLNMIFLFFSVFFSLLLGVKKSNWTLRE